jgi:murein DD-endopeptidase MepM/ murein hydrolase activator NlpD
MARRDWTLGVVLKGTTGLLPQSVSRELVRLGFAAILLVIAFLGSAATQLFRNAQQSIEERDRDMVRTLSALGPEAHRLSWQVDRLTMSLDPLSAEGARPSLIANVDAPAPEASAGEMDDLLRRARVLAFSWREAGDELKRKVDDLAATPSILPTSGFITSKFSWNRFHPILNRPRPHLGVDIVAPMGTPVVASARGRVAFVGRRGEFGLMVEVDHGSGRITRYAHLSRTVVRHGQRVERGDMLGKVGKSGLAVGPHLHYEVLINGRPANPRTFIVENRSAPD